jgi:hypothetical protein
LQFAVCLQLAAYLQLGGKLLYACSKFAADAAVCSRNKKHIFSMKHDCSKQHISIWQQQIFSMQHIRMHHECSLFVLKASL